MEKINITDDIYPEKLKKIDDPPKELYFKGNEKLLNKVSIAIVGSRNFTPYGERVAKYFTKELVLRDIVIISGAARGIDIISHNECINFDGQTIAVLGVSFDKISKKKDKEILQKILDKNGLLLTEYPPGQMYRKENYKQRNRIISGLADAVIIVESAEKGGTSITGKHALKQNKILFAIPNNIFEENSVGSNNFIKKGAFILTSIEDILKKIPEIAKKKRKDIDIQEKMVDKIYGLIEKGINEKQHIVNLLKEDGRIVGEELFKLEIGGFIEYQIGKGYKIIKKKG